MKQVVKIGNNRPIKIWTDSVEGQAMKQLENLSSLPFIHKNGVACMPDVHAGIGSTVGTVIATEKAMIPAALGVDLGCGIIAVKTTLTASDLPENLKPLRHQIERDVPLGAGGAHREESYVSALATRLQEIPQAVIQSYSKNGKAQSLNHVIQKAASQLGSLGSGNHFIEVCLDENQDVWVMIHSGSRGIGNIIGRHYIEKAKREMERYFISLPDADLAYLVEDTKSFDDYVEGMLWAQNYAYENRSVMMEAVIGAMRRHINKPFDVVSHAINCHHNYATRENHFGSNIWVTRKGAIRAQKGDLGVIPGSMGQRSYIVRGLGSAESYCSCSHGAGRVMSRTKAREVFSVEDLKAQTHGVECRKDAAVLDEIPGAYKNIDEVMANQTDLVEVLHTLKQVMCVKGA